MTAVSLADSSVTSSTPGVLTKGTVDPDFDGSNLNVIDGNDANQRMSDQIDSGYIDDAGNAYWVVLQLRSSGEMLVRLNNRADTNFGLNTVQFTETAEENIYLVLFYGSTSAAWEVADLDNSDETNPYQFSSASVSSAGPTNDSTLRNAINADSTVIAMLIDGNHPAIDTTNLTYDDEIVSLADAAVTNSTPGIVVKGTVDPTIVQNDLQVVWGSIAARRMTTALDMEYEANNRTAYWTRLRLLNNGEMEFYLNTSASFNGSSDTRQLSEAAEDNIYIVLWYSGTFVAWAFDHLDVADENNPYNIGAAQVTAAGAENTSDLRTALNESTVIAMLVDGTARGIDTSNWTYSESVIDLRLGANTPDKLYLGANEVDAIYLGSNQVY